MHLSQPSHKASTDTSLDTMASKRPHEAVDPSSTPAAQDAKKRKGFRVGPENLPDGAWRRRNTKIKEGLIQKAKVKKEYRKVKAELQQEKEKAKAKATSSEDDGAAPTTDSQLLPDDGDERDRAHVNPERQALLDGAPMPPMKKREPPPVREAQPRGGQGQDGAGGNGNGNGNSNGNDNDNNNEGDKADNGVPPQDDNHSEPPRRDHKRKLLRPGYYDQALKEGSRKKAEAEARAAEQKRREDERERKLAEREKMRKAMLKARGIKPGAGGNGRGGFGGRGKQQGQRKLGRESKVLLDKVRRMVGS